MRQVGFVRPLTLILVRGLRMVGSQSGIETSCQLEAHTNARG